MECLLVTGVVLLAGALLCARDYSQRRAAYESRPLEDRIRDIREGAASTIQGLERHAARPDLGPKGHHLPALIQFYRRLEALAASPDSTPEEVEALAAEAARFAREHNLKGVFVFNEQHDLTALLRKQKSDNC